MRHFLQIWGSSLTMPASKRSNRALGLSGQFDFSELLLILVDILLQSAEQSLGVLGSHDDAAAHLGLRHSGQMAGKIEHEIAV